jgi:hypothetical protein
VETAFVAHNLDDRRAGLRAIHAVTRDVAASTVIQRDSLNPLDTPNSVLRGDFEHEHHERILGRPRRLSVGGAQSQKDLVQFRVFESTAYLSILAESKPTITAPSTTITGVVM